MNHTHLKRRVNKLANKCKKQNKEEILKINIKKLPNLVGESYTVNKILRDFQ